MAPLPTHTWREPSEPASKVDGRVPSLNALRVIAAGLVMLAHSDLPPGVAKLLEPMDTGQVGVDLFFVLSGYLITRLLAEEEDRTGAIDLGRFYARRGLRILPPLYLFLGAVAFLQLFGVFKYPWVAFVAAAFFVYNNLQFLQFPPFLAFNLWGISHCWTLAVEEQFYAGWAPAFRKLAPRGRLSLVVALVLFEPAARVGFYLIAPHQSWLALRLLPFRLDTLMWGCLLALVERERVFERQLSWILGHGIPPLAPLLIVASKMLAQRFHGHYMLPFGFTVEGFALVAIVAGASRCGRGFWGRLFNHPIVIHLGDVSYDLYLWHALFFTIIGSQVNHSINTTFSGRFPWNFVASLAAAELSFHLTGRPLQGLRRSLNRTGSVALPGTQVEAIPLVGR